jgi:hypothetical protein
MAPLIGLPGSSSWSSSEIEKNDGLWALISTAGCYAELGAPSVFIGSSVLGETRLSSA